MVRLIVLGYGGRGGGGNIGGMPVLFSNIALDIPSEEIPIKAQMIMMERYRIFILSQRDFKFPRFTHYFYCHFRWRHKICCWSFA